jgi:hypothetical protein
MRRLLTAVVTACGARYGYIGDTVSTLIIASKMTISVSLRQIWPMYPQKSSARRNQLKKAVIERGRAVLTRYSR